MLVGLLGLQGAFLDHLPHLKSCGAAHTIIREASALSTIDRLIIPGGESTVMAKFLKQSGLLDPLSKRISQGMPVWGVCAGAILLAGHVDRRPGAIGALPVNVERNAYGRQAASSLEHIDIPLLGLERYPALFIRAPRIGQVGAGVSILARRSQDPVFVQKDRLMATTFHPELNTDHTFHRYFLSL